MLGAALVGILLFVTGPAFAEEVRLESGVVKSGEVVENPDQDITLKERDNTFTIPFSMVAPDQVKHVSPGGGSVNRALALDHLRKFRAFRQLI